MVPVFAADVGGEPHPILAVGRVSLTAGCRLGDSDFEWQVLHWTDFAG
ncbi:hypothetical protein [Pleomorphomonas sp. PLEO]